MTGFSDDSPSDSMDDDDKSDWQSAADDIFTQNFRTTEDFDADVFRGEFEEFNEFCNSKYGKDWLDMSESEDEYSGKLPAKGYIDRILNEGSTESARPDESSLQSSDLADRPPPVEEKSDNGNQAEFDYAALEKFRGHLQDIKKDLENVLPQIEGDQVWVNPGDFYQADHLARRVNGENAGEGKAGLADATRDFISKLNGVLSMTDEKLLSTMNHYETAEDFQEMTGQELEKFMNQANGEIDGLGEGAYADISAPKPQ